MSASLHSDPICAGTFEDYLEAEDFRNRLRAAGIPAETVGTQPSSGFGLSMGQLSRASVMVPARFAARLRRWSSGAAAQGSIRSAQPHAPMRMPRRR